MKKSVIAGTLALAILLGGASFASAAGMKDKLELIRAKVVGGESKAADIHAKLESYIDRAEAKGLDTSSANDEMDQAEASYDTLMSELGEFKTMLDSAIAAGGAPGDGSLKAQGAVVKEAGKTFKADMLDVKDALKALKPTGVPAGIDTPAL